MIVSKDNKLIKFARQLKQKKYSRECGKCFVETYKIVRDLYVKGYVDTVFLTNSKKSLKDEFKNVNVEYVADFIADFLSDNVTNEGVFAICKIKTSCDKIDYSKCLILDNIQDPSNFGAIIRSACAFNYKTIICINSVYPFSSKSIRCSMAYVFDVNFIYLNYDGLKKLKDDYSIKILSADMIGDNIDNFERLNSNYAIAIGNEGNGISNEIKSLSDKFLSIPMNNNVESLNASVSASIIMYLLK